MERTELLKEFQRLLDIVRSDGTLERDILPKFNYDLMRLEVSSVPASVKHHHAYKYGLLQHTIEVCQILEKISDLYDLNKPILLLLGLLHDIGKMYEYKNNNGIWEKIDLGISHTQYIYAILKHDGYHKLAKIVGTHMGKKEWGAINNIEETDDKYCWALYLADMTSAKLGGRKE